MTLQKVTIDTNFFITLFSTNTDRFKKLNEIFKRLKIKIVLSSYVVRELRWYMERVIAPHCEIYTVNAKKLENYEKQIRPKVGKLPQTPDVSVAYVAEKEGIPLISSDLKLIQISDKLGIKTFMNSAFAIWLLDQIELTEDRIYLEKCYHDLFEEEISYSVKSQNVYDPVIRIQAIMDSALRVVRESRIAEVDIKEELVQEVFPENYDFPEYRELFEMTKGYRRDLDRYITMMESGNQHKLLTELRMISHNFMDHCSEVRLLGVPETDLVYKGALTTLAHILLLQSTVALGHHKLKEAEATVDLMLLLIFEVEEIADKLEMEVHLQRILIFFLTQQIARLKIYFTPAFYAKCSEKGREDVIDLIRTFGILSAVISNEHAEETATVKDFNEIQFTMQLGYQFITVGKPKFAWLLLEQAIYMAVNSKITGLIYAVMEVLLPLHFAYQRSKTPMEPSIQEIMKYIEENTDNVPLDPYYQRLDLKEKANPEILIKRAKSVSNLPTTLRGFLDVISAEQTKFTRIGDVILVTVIDWQTMNLIGIVDPTMSLDHSLTVGSSVQIHSGKVRLIEAPAKLKKAKGLSLMLVCKPDKLKFITRRSGIVSIIEAKEKVSEFDID